MSSNQDEVQISSDNGYKLQWAKGLFYRKEGNKHVLKSEYVKVLIGILFVLTCTLTLFQEDPTANSKGQQAFDVNSIELVRSVEIKPFDVTKVVKQKRKVAIIKVEPLSVVSRSEKLTIPLGAQTRARLVTGGTNGPVKAELLEDLMFNGETFLPQGSLLWGKGSSTKKRLIVTFSKAVLRDGSSKDISATAYDPEDEILGLKGSIIGRTSKKILAGAGLGMAGALKTMQSAENVGGLPVAKPTIGNALLNGGSEAALGLAEQEMEELKNEQTIIEVEKGSEIIVVFGEG